MNPLLWSGGNHKAASMCRAGHVEPCEQENDFLNFGLFKDVSQMYTFSRSMLLGAISNKFIETLFLPTIHSPSQCNKYSTGLSVVSLVNIPLKTVPGKVRNIRSVK
jgi:hypothetical protein